MKKKICIVLTTRGSYAKFISVIEALNKEKNVKLYLIEAGALILDKYGKIINTSYSKKLKLHRRINYIIEGEDLYSMTKSAGIALVEFSEVFNQIKPNIVMLLGDRYETLPIAIAAAYQNITLVHLEGGEITGSIDESIRHSITKLSHIHFPCTANAKKRIIKMGEDKNRVFNFGSTSLDYLKAINLNDINFINDYQINHGVGPNLEFKKKNYLIVIFHPVTTEYKKNFNYANILIDAIQKLKINTIWINSNLDAGNDGISKSIRTFISKKNNKNIKFFKSLPIEMLAPLLKNCLCIVGNSSSGIRESSYLGTYSVNIGTRQNNREMAKNVISIKNNKIEIINAIKKQIQKKPSMKSKLYGEGKAGVKIVKTMLKISVDPQKKITY